MIFEYLNILKELLAFTSDTEFPIFVFEKPNVNQQETLTKDGIHVIIGLKMKKELQLMLREKMLKILPNIWEHLPLINEWTSVLDEGISKLTCNWQLYGSRKPANEAYELVSYWKCSYDTTDGEFITNINQFVLTVDNFNLLSCQYPHHPSLDIKVKTNTKYQSDVIINNIPVEACNIQSTDEIAEKAEIIDLKYINSYPDWFKIICSLKNNSLNNHTIALHITKKSKHYDKINGQQYFQERWDEIPVGKYNYSIGTFNHYAKSSNSKSYYEIIAKYRKTEISTVLKSPTEENIAKCFHSLFGEDFLFSNEIVYHWNGIVWEQSKTALRRCFTNEFTQIFLNVQISYLNDMKNVEAGSDDYMFLSKKNKIITEIIINLQRNGLIKAVVNDAIKPYIENNNVEFEMNPFSFCFNDKVFDLRKCEFMEPNKDDHMTLTTGYNYRKPTADETKTLNDLFDKVFPVPEERKLYLISLATGFYGKTLEKFILANGSGRNGKGFTNELVLKTVGNYGYTCSNSVLLNPIKDGPNPTIANLNNMRIVFYREPDTDNNKKINSSTVKELTGGNEINARGLYSGNTKTQLKATHILECNTKPKMSGETDDAIFMRLIDMGFRSTFTKFENDVDESNYIFQGNDRIKDLDFQEQHKFALFHILVDHWKHFHAENLNIDKFIPASILDRSKEYLKNSNEMFLWFEENYEKVEDDTEVIEVSAIFEEFKNSNVCLNYTKAEKRELNRSKFIEKISKNLFLRKFYKERERRKEVCEKYKCKEMRNVLVGFKVMVEKQEMN
jgi:phage/plasmid-associated DNA primase